MKVAIVGSRNFNDYNLLDRVIRKNIDFDDIDEIVSGGAKGADRLGERFATINKIKKNIYYPDWNKYGKQAGFLRNIKIVRNSDIVFAFWDGRSRGTMHTINLCKEHDKKVIVQKFKGEYMNRVIMIDGNNVAHISFHSAQNIARKNKITKDERETFLEGMTYHLFFNKLFSFMKQFKGHYFITWDMKGSIEWRQEISKDYKANRKLEENPDNRILFKAMNNLRAILPTLPIYQFIQQGFEADDIIYQCTLEINKFDAEGLIISNDTDLLQIVQQFSNMKQFDPKKNKFMQAPEEYDITIYKALAGDSTDNISGVKGIGKTTAEKLATEVYGLNNIKRLKVISELLKNDKEKIQQFEESFNMINIENNPNLFNIKIDLDYLFSEKEINLQAFQAFLEKYKMNSHIKNLEKTIKLFNSLYEYQIA